jgi:hypothetical protein
MTSRVDAAGWHWEYAMGRVSRCQISLILVFMVEDGVEPFSNRWIVNIETPDWLESIFETARTRQ